MAHRVMPDSGADPVARAPRTADALYSSLFEQNHSVMLLIDPATGRIVDANRAAAAFYGWSREELAGKAMDDINALSREQVAAAMARARNREQHYFRFRHRLASGEERDVEVCSGPVQLGGHHLLYSIVHDITRRREMEQRLERSESLQRIGGRLARVGGWAVDLATRTVYLSDELCCIIGMPPGTALTVQETIDYYAPEYREEVSAAYEACVREGTPYDAELELLRPDGVRLWARTIGQAIRDETGRIVGVHGAFQDITEQRRERERLHQLWLAVEQSPESIIITDLKPAISFVNDATCRRSGYERSELLGRNPGMLASGKTPAATYATMWATLRQGRPWSGTFYNRRKDGREYTESVSITPLRQPDGSITHFLAIQQDISEKRHTEMELARYRDQLEELVAERTGQLAEARQEAEAASRAKSSFLARMSHEIRTPMNGILGSIEILERQPLSRDQAELLETIRESGRALLHIIDDILDFSRIEAGRLQLDVDQFALADLVESLGDSMVPLALEKDVDLSCYVAPELPRFIIGDDVRLRQILMNLVGNAIKFSARRAGQRGRVDLRVMRATAGDLRIEVEDNGIGISEEAQAGLFQPFSQSEEATTRRFGGSGLGLIICKRLTEMMRGSIGMESAPGRGSLFWVRLPLIAAPDQPDASLPDLAGLKVGLCAHDRLPAAYFERYLAAAGAAVDRLCGDAGGADVVIAVAEDAVSAGREKLPAGVGQVLLQREVRRTPQHLAPRMVTLSLAATRRRALLEAVAAAAGRLMAPVADDPREPGIRATQPVLDIETAAARGELILVAEDDAINRKVVLRQLQLLGRAAEVAEDGEQALATWRRGRTALLLTDLHMPGLDGYGLTRAIREAELAAGRPQAQRTPIIALTANALRGEAERVAELGFDDYVTKPATLERLRAVLDRWLPGDDGPVEGAREEAGKSPAEETVLDIGVLKRLIGTEGALVDEFLTAFLESATGLAADIERACLTRDKRQLAAVTHKLKSSARSVGALALGELSARIERQARVGEVDFDQAPGREIHTRLDAVRHEIAHRRSGK